MITDVMKTMREDIREEIRTKFSIDKSYQLWLYFVFELLSTTKDVIVDLYNTIKNKVSSLFNKE